MSLVYDVNLLEVYDILYMAFSHVLIRNSTLASLKKYISLPHERHSRTFCAHSYRICIYL